MGSYDTQQVCMNGHQITDSFHRYPEHRRDFCKRCGAKTIHQCQNCGAEIAGDYHVDGVASIGFSTPVPRFCERCGAEYPWADKLDEDEVVKLDPAISIERICNRIPLVVRQLRIRHDGREAHDVQDEYDLQDLLHSLLQLFFDDVRPEEHTPSYAGKAARMDFLLKEESIVIEAKMTRKGLGAKEIGEQLIIDIARYREHPSCSTLFCLVYDPEHRVANPRGLEADLSRSNDGLKVKVFVVPRGI